MPERPFSLRPRTLLSTATAIPVLAAALTTWATSEIDAHVRTSRSATAEATRALPGTVERIRRIDHAATSIAAAVGQQGAATQELVRSVVQAELGTCEVRINIACVVRAAGETGSAARQVHGSASDLSGKAGCLATEMDRFLATARAA